jgi:hypothetical protein
VFSEFIASSSTLAIRRGPAAAADGIPGLRLVSLGDGLCPFEPPLVWRFSPISCTEPPLASTLFYLPTCPIRGGPHRFLRRKSSSLLRPSAGAPHVRFNSPYPAAIFIGQIANQTWRNSSLPVGDIHRFAVSAPRSLLPVERDYESARAPRLVRRRRVRKGRICETHGSIPLIRP